jgi:hypothetical protein
LLLYESKPFFGRNDVKSKWIADPAAVEGGGCARGGVVVLAQRAAVSGVRVDGTLG